MTPAQAALLKAINHQITEKYKQLALYSRGGFRMLHNNVDVTPESRAMLQKEIEDLEALVRKHDPQGLVPR